MSNWQCLAGGFSYAKSVLVNKLLSLNDIGVFFVIVFSLAHSLLSSHGSLCFQAELNETLNYKIGMYEAGRVFPCLSFVQI